MKKSIIILLLLIISLSVFAQSDSTDKEFDSGTNYKTFSQIKTIHDLPELFEFLKEFVSWKHWRYWIGLIGAVFLWLLFIIINGSLHELFSKPIQKKLVKKEGIYYLFWIGYTFILAIVFTFGYNHLADFFSNMQLWDIPKGSHWVIWILWGGLILLLIGALPAIIREIIIFKIVSLYTIPCQIVHAVIGMILVFFATTAVTYFTVAIGLVLGIIVGIIAALTILTFIIKNMGGPRSGYAKNTDDDYDKKVKEINRGNKKRNEDYNRWKDRQEKYNREQMKKNRGW